MANLCMIYAYCTDIVRKVLIGISDADAKPDKMVLTVHRWFANNRCETEMQKGIEKVIEFR
jgi:hypothetical protein